jgi:hypothetical protein
MTITLVPINALRQHEQILNENLMRVQRDLVRDGMVKDPIIVDQRTMVILDGHHARCGRERHLEPEARNGGVRSR